MTIPDVADYDLPWQHSARTLTLTALLKGSQRCLAFYILQREPFSTGKAKLGKKSQPFFMSKGVPMSIYVYVGDPWHRSLLSSRWNTSTCGNSRGTMQLIWSAQLQQHQLTSHTRHRPWAQVAFFSMVPTAKKCWAEKAKATTLEVT